MVEYGLWLPNRSRESPEIMDSYARLVFAGLEHCPGAFERQDLTRSPRRDAILASIKIFDR